MRNLLTIGLLLAGLLGSAVLPSMVSPLHAQNFTLEESAFGNAGGSASVGGRTLTGMAGQVSPEGQGVSGAYTLFSGFPSPFFAIRAVSVVLEQPLSEAQPSGSAVTLTAQIRSRIAPVEDVTLFYRKGGDNSYTTTPMDAADGTAYQAAIPEEAVTGEGVAFFITATDAEGNTARHPARGVRSFRVRVDDPGLVKDDALPSGSRQSAYRLISMPIALDNQAPSAVLGDDVSSLQSSSAYDPSEARFFEPIDGSGSGTERSVEFPNAGSMQQGDAFWIIVREGAEDIDTGGGEVSSLNQPFEIELESNWNFVGNPFNFPVPVENLRTADGQDIVLRSYGTEGYNTPENPVTAMQPFSGYAMRSEGETTLLIDPDIADENPDENAASKERKVAHQGFQPAWTIRIRARAGQSFDVNNLAAVSSQASRGKDPMDWPEPPPIASDVTVSFPHPDWETGATYFSSDVRAIPAEGETWSFEVETAQQQPIALSFDGLARVPEAFEAWLLDEYTKASQDLRTTPRYTIEDPSPEQTRRFRLVVGESSYVKRELETAGALPASYTLADIYPNPTRGASTIRYGLPTKQEVTLTVYNVLGQKVATLMRRESREPGFHTLQWDGRSGSGAPVASGVYFVRMRAGDFTTSKKIVRVN